MGKIKDYLRVQRSIGTYLDVWQIILFYEDSDFYEYYDKFCEKKFTGWQKEPNTIM
jgi:hypothetical protein